MRVPENSPVAIRQASAVLPRPTVANEQDFGVSCNGWPLAETGPPLPDRPPSNPRVRSTQFHAADTDGAPVRTQRHAVDYTSVVPSSVWVHCPVVRSQTRTVLSCAPDTTVRPSALNRHAAGLYQCVPSSVLGALPGGEIPDSDGFCPALRDTTGAPVRTQRHAVDYTSVSLRVFRCTTRW